MGKNILLPILSTYNGKGVEQAKSSLASLSSSVAKAAKGFIAYQAVAGATSFATDLVKQASDLQRNTAGLTTIFGDNAKAMQEWAAGASSMGMSSSDASKAATFLGSVLKGAGFDINKTSEETKRLTSLAADLAATYGYDVQEALTGISALFRGEYDPIEKFGVAIKQSQVNAMLAARGLDKLTGSALLHAQQMVRLEMLYGATGSVQGAYAHQQGTLFVATNNLVAVFHNLEAAIGEPLLKPLADLMTQLTTLFLKVEGGSGTFANGMAAMIASFTPLFLGLAQLIVGFADFFDGIASGVALSLKPLLAILGGITTALGWLLMALGPIAPALGFIATALLLGFASGMAWKALVSVYETVALSVMYLKDAFYQLAAGETVATVATKGFQLALASTGIGLVVVGIGLFTQHLMGMAGAADVAAASQANLNYQIATMPIPASPTGAPTDAAYKSNFKLPGAPKPGETASWYQYEGQTAVWYTQTWDGKKWSKAKKMTGPGTVKNTGGSGAIKPKGESKAQKRMKQQKAVIAQFVADVKSMFGELNDSLMGAFDLSNFGKSATSMLRNANRMVEKMKKFATNLKALQAMNLNPTLMNQIISAGPLEGGAIAEALMKGGAGTIGGLNTAYGQYGALSSEIAGIGTKGYYGNSAVQNTYNIQVSGGIGDKNTIGKSIVDAIAAYEKTSGTAWRA